MKDTSIPNIQRIYVLVKDAGSGQVELGFSLMPPATIDATMAVLVLRGVLPVGFPLDIPLISDPSIDPDLRGAPGQNATDAQVAAAVSAYLAAHPPAAGKDGTSPTLTIGKVTSLPPGSTATVTNSGTASAIVLDIGIPIGATGAPGATGLGTVTIGETATVAIQAGIRQVTIAGATGVKKGDNILLFPTAPLAAGYAVLGAVATDDATLQVSLLVPLIAIGGKYSITARAVRIG